MIAAAWGPATASVMIGTASEPTAPPVPALEIPVSTTAGMAAA